MRSLHSGRGPAMADPPSSSSSSSSPSSSSSSSSLPIQSDHGAACSFQRPYDREWPLSKGLDWNDGVDEGFLVLDDGAYTLRQHDVALCALEQLDELWFFQNVLTLPQNGGSRLLQTPHQGSTDLPSPFRSLEMVQTVAACTDARTSSLPELSMVRFGKLRLRCGGDERGEPLALTASEDAGTGGSDCCDSSRELLTDRNEVMHYSMAADDPQPLLIKRKEEEVYGRDSKANRGFETNVFPAKDVCGTMTLTTLKVEIVEPQKENLLPLAQNSANMHLIQRPRRRKQNKLRPKATEYSELDEMRGFRELGLNLSQDKLAPCLINLFPGKIDYAEDKNYSELRFPSSTQYKLYSYPAWWIIAKPNSPLYNWQFPDPNQEGVDMKAHLKFWARAVASTVKQEC